MQPSTAPLPTILADIPPHFWTVMAAGVGDRNHPAHVPTVATIAADGAPRMRSMVLRGCDPEARQLRFHTDRRAAKHADLAADPRIAIHVYDALGRAQWRATGACRIHQGDAVARAAWDGAATMSRQCYRVAPAPGTRIAGDGDFDLAALTLEDGFAQFAVLVVTLQEIEWLHLRHGGHRRALFQWREAAWQGAWCVP